MVAKVWTLMSLLQAIVHPQKCSRFNPFMSPEDHALTSICAGQTESHAVLTSVKETKRIIYSALFLWFLDLDGQLKLTIKGRFNFDSVTEFQKIPMGTVLLHLNIHVWESGTISENTDPFKSRWYRSFNHVLLDLPVLGTVFIGELFSYFFNWITYSLCAVIGSLNQFHRSKISRGCKPEQKILEILYFQTTFVYVYFFIKFKDKIRIGQCIEEFLDISWPVSKIGKRIKELETRQDCFNVLLHPVL